MVVELRSGHKVANNNDYSGQNVKAGDANGTNNVGTHKMTYVIFIGLLIDLLAFTLILPLFPALLDHYKRHDPPGSLYHWLDSSVKSFGSRVGAPERFNSVLFGGLLGSLFSMLQFLTSPIVGGLSDCFGRRPMLLLSTAGIAVSYGVWAFSTNFGLFVLARIIGGLSKGNVSLATAVIADVSSPKTRQKGMALIGIAFSVGFIVGPLMGAGFAVWAKAGQQNKAHWYAWPACVALLLSLTDLLYLACAFTETLPAHKRTHGLQSALSQAATYVNPVCLFRFSSLKNLPDHELAGLRTVGKAYFVYLFLYSGLEFTLTFLTHLRFGFTSMDQGKMFLFVGLIMAFVQGGYVRRIQPGKEKAMVLRGLLLIVPSFAAVGFANSKWMLYFGLMLYALSTAVVVPCMTTLVSNYGDVSQKGIVMGVYRSLGALGRALGPIFASVLYWMVGPEMCYSLGGLALIIPYFMLKQSKNVP